MKATTLQIFLAVSLALSGKSVFAVTVPDMISIPGGLFTMGCVEGRDNVAGNCVENEKPAQPVNVDAFKLAKTEVTLAQFRAFIDDTAYQTTAEQAGSCWSRQSNGVWSYAQGHSWQDLGFAQTDNDPVACISWHDAQAYTEWLSGKTGETYRLPTEAEWEYAARAGTEFAYSWGQCTSGCKHANMADAKGQAFFDDWAARDCAPCNDGYSYTAPVAHYQANPFGLHDMHGNVWEWTQDTYRSYSNDDETAEHSAHSAHSDKRVYRGGSWDEEPWQIRAAYRQAAPENHRHSLIGFRVAADMTK